MAAPSAPTNLSADATNGTTAELRWSAPDDNGGFPIASYDVFRGINGATPSLLVNTGNTDTKYSDTTLLAQQNAVYQVKAKNTEPSTGPLSDSASTTTATSEAQTIEELLFDNWSLTGQLAKATTGDMTEPIHFFNRGQVPGNKFAKSITVQKINALGNENLVEHPKFFEQSDTFEITCFLQVPDAADDVFSVWIDFMQQMTGEVVRILKTVYSPSQNTGEFFRTTSSWSRDDTFFPDDPELTRTLRFTLTRILSNDPEVFLGYGGVLVFDTSASEGDDKPTSDYEFTQATDIDIEEGFEQIPILTKDKSKGVGVPQLVRGMFSGTFRAVMFAKKSDIIGTTTEKLQNIYRTQTNPNIVNQNAEVVFLQSNPNTESESSVSLISITNGGSSYVTAPSVVFSGGGGTGAIATASISGGQVVLITVTNGGSSYVTAPTVTFTGGSGSGATATASIAVVLTTSSFMKIDNITKNEEDEQLLSYTVHGILSRPTEYALTPTPTKNLPTAPQNLNAVNAIGDIVNNTWDAPLSLGDSPLVSYRLEHNIDSGGWFEIVKTLNLFASDSSVSGGQSVQYRVRAENMWGFGPYSNIDTVVVA